MTGSRNSESQTGIRTWKPAILYALPIAALVLGLFVYWFAFADRYFIFLYYHDMGPLVPDTSPFSRVTASRYWMAGLVASGAVMVIYTLLNWLLGRMVKTYQTPVWWQVWIGCAVPLVIGIPAITMTANHPTLPLWNAIQTTLATLIGLALALMPGQPAAERPKDLIWLAFDGFGLMLVLSGLRGLEYFPRWVAAGSQRWVRMTIILLAAGVVWLLIVTGLHVFRQRSVKTVEIFLAGCCMTYLFMPLMHYLMFTDGYYYITNSDNFFAQNLLFQVAIWLIVGGLTWGLARLQQAIQSRRYIQPT